MNLPLMSREVISAGAAMLIAQGGVGEEVEKLCASANTDIVYMLQLHALNGLLIHCGLASTTLQLPSFARR